MPSACSCFVLLVWGVLLTLAAAGCSGGPAFVAVQGAGWVLFGLSLASIMWLVAQVAAGMAYCVRCWVLMTSSFFLSAELVRCCGWASLPPSLMCTASCPISCKSA